MFRSGGHAERQEKEARGFRFMWPGLPPTTPTPIETITWILSATTKQQFQPQTDGYRFFWIGKPLAAPVTIFNDLSWHRTYSTFGLRLRAYQNALLTPGHKGYYPVPFSGTIMEMTLLADNVGSIEIDIDRSTNLAILPTPNQTIIGLAAMHPQLNGAQSAKDLALYSWQRQLNKGDILGFRVLSVSGIKFVTLALTIDRTG